MKRIEYPSEQEILFLKGVVNYTEFHLTNGKKIVSSSTLKRHEEELNGFLRVSKSHLLNPEYIKRLHRFGAELKVELKGGRRIGVSRRRKKMINEIQLKQH
jgi:two-component system LytT family response regulator